MKPPRLARLVLRAAAPARDRATLLEELGDEFDRRREQEGLTEARRWYWRQTVGSALPLLRSRLRRSASAGTIQGGTLPWRDAARWLLRHRRLTAVCVFTLAVATSTAVTGGIIAHRVILRGLPFPASDRIIALWNTGPTLPAGVRAVSFQDLEDWRARSTSLHALSGETRTTYTLSGRGEPRLLEAARVARDFDRVLGIAPAAGRFFEPGHYEVGSHTVVMLTHAFWQREFGGSPEAVGRHLTLDSRPHEIVGVLPPMPTPVPSYAHDVLVPLIARPGVTWENSRGTAWLTAIGRLRSDVSTDRAREELSAIAAALQREHPGSNRERAAIGVNRLQDEIVGDSAQPLALLAAAVAAVLLVACANLTNLLLTYAARRKREFAVRLALGADRQTVVKQIAAEALLLAGVGVGVGAALVPMWLRAFVALYPGQLPRAGELAFGPEAAGAAALLAVAGALLLALPQVRLLANRGLTAEVRHGARVTSSRGERRTRNALVALQVAFCVVLLTGGIVFVRTLTSLAGIDPGFRREGVLTFSVSPSPAKFGGAAQTAAFFRDLVASLRTLPDVQHVAAATAVPFVSRGWQFSIENRRSPGDTRTLVGVSVVSPEYFEALGMRLREGRLFDAAEHNPAAAPVVILNDSLASLLFPDGGAAGRTVPYDGERLIVGVVGGTRRRMGDRAAPELYMPWHNAGRAPQRVILRAAGDPMALLPAVRARVHALDADTPIANIDRLDDVVEQSLGAQRFRAAVVALLATVALALAALGVYSVTALTVAMQERENGVRRALGEPPRQAARRIVTRALRPAIMGLVAGTAVVMLLARSIQAFLYETSARDPVVLAAVGAALMLVAVAASIGPARRALRLDPASTLRVD